MVPVDSVGVSRDPTYSGTVRPSLLAFRVRDCHPLWYYFPENSTTRSARPFELPYNPQKETLWVWALPCSLAATKGIDFSFSSTGYLDVSVHQVCHICLWIQHMSFRNPGINVCLSTTPGFSQTSTPFIAFLCQDIPRAPLYTWPHEFKAYWSVAWSLEALSRLANPKFTLYRSTYFGTILALPRLLTLIK